MKFPLVLLTVLLVSNCFSQDKDLSLFLAKAQTNSPLLKDLSNQIQSNKIDSLLNRANYKSQISGNLTANYAPNYNGFGYDTAITNGQTVSGLIGINQKIIGKNRMNTQAETFQIVKEGLVLNK